ncbi:MAG: MoxR family ATPase [Bacteroidales bacterium]|nr:MoxR family ATPase [Clostridium sp.]MCM1202839.1 MoxR family ATPase [Bacteroidales bacterium]
MSKTTELTGLNALKNNIQQIIVGKQDKILLLLTALLAGGHILLEDTPGTGKTMLAKALATSIDGTYKRVQFTPDLLPSDVTGVNVYNQKNQEFSFIPGPIFTNILLADEINRATPRTQSCLLEAMAEGQVTTDGVTRRLSEPFFMIATENPIETAGTFPLPEAQLDRFAMKISLGFPNEEEELAILNRYLTDDPMAALAPVCSLEDILAYRKQITGIFLHEDIKTYLVRLIEATRNHDQVALGINPRGTLSLMRCAQAYAFLHGRSYVIPEDIKYLAKPCLAHRLLSFNHAGSGTFAASVIDDILSSVPVPTENFEQ